MHIQSKKWSGVQYPLKSGVNLEIVHVEYVKSNFWMIAVMYIVVYIFEMEMSQRIHFKHQMLMKLPILIFVCLFVCSFVCLFV